MTETPSGTAPETSIPKALSVYRIAGVDEVGRGPLAGPVVAAAVILNPQKPIEGLLDSKLLNESTRQDLDVLIRHRSLAYCIAQASVAEIDTLNILHASMLAMKRAVEGLSIAADIALIDGNRCPELEIPVSAIVKGDQRVQAISAASIIAKVARDKMMIELDASYPVYGLAKHKGYPTPFHRQAIIEHGVMSFHRTSFKPVREALERSSSQTATSAVKPTSLQQHRKKAQGGTDQPGATVEPSETVRA